MDQFTAHLDRGWDLVSRGDYAGALLSAQKSLELDAESPEAHNLVGYIHQIEGRAEDALDHYRQAIAIDETYVEAMLNAAEVMIHGLKDLDGGLSMLDEALDFAEGIDPHVGVLLDDLLDESGKPVTPTCVPVRAGRLFVYQRNIERWISGTSEVDDEILRNLEHEIMLAFPQLSPKDAPEE